MTREAAQEFAVSKGLIGRKVGMTTVFGTDGSAQAVTVVEVQPNVVFGHRTTERDGYTALKCYPLAVPRPDDGIRHISRRTVDRASADLAVEKVWAARSRSCP